ncbi:iron-sulfur cluster insertion protein ErpA [Aestuariivirga sp.]|jgi:iron-sulfur cluster assembly accessory protein|uniref:iron-sulfur cluster insertion protein ErpA n=1 Tax=Aestuariivirga sp. TaxID=2650926 RepID=UPI00378426F4
MSGSIILTDRAAARIRQILSGKPGKTALRVAVNGGGCSGFQYDFQLVDSAAVDDLIIEHGGARALIDPVSQGFLNGAEIDFVDDLMGQSFKIRNPNATSSCGCGTSFSV